MTERWRNASTIGPWHHAASGKSFRFYSRENEAGEVWLFADYRVLTPDGPQVSRRHKLLPVEHNELSAKLANRTCIEITAEQLAVLRDGWLLKPWQDDLVRQATASWRLIVLVERIELFQEEHGRSPSREELSRLDSDLTKLFFTAAQPVILWYVLAIDTEYPRIERDIPAPPWMPEWKARPVEEVWSEYESVEAGGDGVVGDISGRPGHSGPGGEAAGRIGTES